MLVLMQDRRAHRQFCQCGFVGVVAGAPLSLSGLAARPADRTGAMKTLPACVNPWLERMGAGPL